MSQPMKQLHWECNCGTSGNVEYLTWDFQEVSNVIVQQHAKVCPYTGFNYRTTYITMRDLDIEVSEDLLQAKMRHIQ